MSCSVPVHDVVVRVGHVRDFRAVRRPVRPPVRGARIPHRPLAADDPSAGAMKTCSGASGIVVPVQSTSRSSGDQTVGLMPVTPVSMTIGFDPSAFATTRSPCNVGSSVRVVRAQSLVGDACPVVREDGRRGTERIVGELEETRAVWLDGVDLVAREESDPPVGRHAERRRRPSDGIRHRPAAANSAAMSRPSRSRSGVSRGTEARRIVSCI